MKKVLLPMLLLLVAFACSKDEPVTPTLSVSPKSIEESAAESVVDLKITSNVSWSISSTASDWIKLSSTSGSGDATIKVTLSENESLDPRTAKITIKGENMESVIEVEQSGVSKQEFFTNSKWEMISQNSGEAGYDDLVGTVLELKENNKAVAIMDIDVESVQIQRVEGTWKVDDENLKIEGMLGSELKLDLIFDIKQVSDIGMTCQMKVNLPLLPADGIEVVFKKL